VNVTSPKVWVSPLHPAIEEIVANMLLVPGGTTRLPTLPTSGGINVYLDAFSIGKYEVTQIQWLAVMGGWPGSGVYNSQSTVPEEEVPSTAVGLGNNYPAYWIRWDDIVGTSSSDVAYTEKDVTYYKNGFCYKLSQLVDPSGIKHFRLPTEAEWEYAAKGGQQTHNYEYSGGNGIDSVAWNSHNSYDEGVSYGTHIVGTRSPNELGLYDMSGNVWEWCSDGHGTPYPSTANNPTGDLSSSTRVTRGGAWQNDPYYCTVSTHYYSSNPSYRDNILGFRLVLP
jgi:formylglycine-generating enzyme required for sulfatase activity